MSRVSGLLAIAVLGLALTTVYNGAIDREPAGVRAVVDPVRSQLAGAEVGDPRARRSVEEAFIAGYRVVVRLGAALAVAGALGAALLIEAPPHAAS